MRLVTGGMLLLSFTFWLGFTPKQPWSLAVDPSGQRGDTDTQYLLAAWSSTDTDTSTSDSNLWMGEGGERPQSSVTFSICYQEMVLKSPSERKLITLCCFPDVLLM